jgi:hypothetical protein
MPIPASIPVPPSLPVNPSLEHLRKQSKRLLRDLQRQRPEAKLCEAQRQVAQAQGFPSWPKLKAHIDARGAAPLGDAIRALREGRCVILFDDTGHENEGDFVLAAEKASPDAINFMVRNGGGTLCLALPPEQIDRLGLAPINETRSSLAEPAFTAGVDAAEGRSAEREDARTRVSLARRGRRRDHAPRPHRRLARAHAPCWAPTGRRHHRDLERRRHDGAAPRCRGAVGDSWRAGRQDLRAHALNPRGRAGRRGTVDETSGARHMMKIAGLGAIVLGAVLLFYGLTERQSLTSQVKEVFTGTPTDHSVLLIASGGGLVAVGLGLAVFGKKPA